MRFFRRDVTTASAIQKIFFFFFWLISFVVVLDILSIPIAVFAFIGGGLVVVIGLGAKDLVSSTLDGLIVMFSRSVRIGDIIEVSGVKGKIEDIGYRSVYVQTSDNAEVEIPTHDLRNGTVINYTRSGGKNHDSVAVSVDLSHSSDEICNILIEAALDVSFVMKDPPPCVRLRDFSGNAAEYELRYWFDMLEHEKENIAACVRKHILDCFISKNIQFK